MKTILKVTKLEKPPFVLHEEMARGKFGEKSIRVIRNVNNSILYVTVNENNYQVNITDIVTAILEVD